MGLKIYGIGAAQNPDKDGQTIIIKNMDVDRLSFINDEHGDKMFDMIGTIQKFKKIMNEKECEDDKQLRCWNSARVPFLYVEGELADDENHPNAEAAASLIKFTAKRPDSMLHLGLSIEGGILEKEGPGNNILSKTMATGVTITVKPCNPKCVLFPEVDLMKSAIPMEPPASYFEALKKANHTPNFGGMARLAKKVEELKKSLDDYVHGFTHIKCNHCGKTHRFFKSSKSVPNGCDECGKHFRMSDIWTALNR